VTALIPCGVVGAGGTASPDRMQSATGGVYLPLAGGR
jgi:hypothetical protein